MTLDMLNLAQHPRAFADFLLLVTYTAAIFVSLRWHRWIWICYLVGALAHPIVVAIAEPASSPPMPGPSRDVLFHLCSRDAVDRGSFTSVKPEHPYKHTSAT